MKEDIVSRIIWMLKQIDDTRTLTKIMELVQHFFIRQ